MVEYSERFGERVREILVETESSPNSVEFASRKQISHATVRRMRQGFPPSSDHIIAFAEAVTVSAEKRHQYAEELLLLAGSRATYRFASVMPAPVQNRALCGAGA